MDLGLGIFYLSLPLVLLVGRFVIARQISKVQFEMKRLSKSVWDLSSRLEKLEHSGRS